MTHEGFGEFTAEAPRTRRERIKMKSLCSLRLCGEYLSTCLGLVRSSQFRHDMLAEQLHRAQRFTEGEIAEGELSDQIIRRRFIELGLEKLRDGVWIACHCLAAFHHLVELGRAWVGRFAAAEMI